MVQFNLLPDVKLQFVKAQRLKYLLTLISIAAGGAALAIFLLAFLTVNVVQRKSLHDVNKDIATYSSQLKGTKDLDKILTVQNQLGTLTSLHDQKPVTSRLFSYLSQLTPTQASLNNLSLDFTANTISLTGAAPSLDTVSLYTDTLKATVYTTESNTTPTKAFSNVVLSSFGRSDAGATFDITASFDPIIFNSAHTITLQVPANANANQSSIFGTGN